MAKTMILPSIFLAYVATISFTFVAKGFMVEANYTTGFTIDLIHRDSPQSPTYNPSVLPSQRLTKALQRSLNRLQRFRTRCVTGTPVADIFLFESDGEFLMKYFVGTPPILSYGIADTGSDLIWTQCSPCIKCFKQKLPLFNSSKSSTFQTVSCQSASCKAVPQGHCSETKGICAYRVSYEDGSVTEGEVASDTIGLGSTRGQRVSFPKVTIGCGFKNYGIFSGEESGVVGLGGGEFSLVNQIYPSIQGKFSYCLVPLSSNTTSKMNFGANAVVSGKGVVSTPLVSKQPKTYYFLTLLGVSIGHQRLELHDHLSNDSKSAVQEGNIIIDSGATLTFLPYKFYEKIEKRVKSMIKLRPIKDPQGFLDLCYHTEKQIQFSDIIFHFKGADVVLKPENIFTRRSDVTMCLAFKPSDGVAIYGNLAQLNFLVGYDLGKKTLSFKPTDCSRS